MSQLRRTFLGMAVVMLAGCAGLGGITDFDEPEVELLGLEPLKSQLKIPVSAVRFCLWAPIKSAAMRVTGRGARKSGQCAADRPSFEGSMYPGR
jgi:hypothetical protein